MNIALLVGVGLVLALAGVAALRRVKAPAARRAVSAGILVVTVLVLAGVVSEVVSATVYDAPVTLEYGFFREYRPGYFKLAPNADRVFPAFPGWHASEARTNEDGVRTARSRSSLVPDRTVLFLGDSFTFGLFLDAADTYPQQVENRLDRSGAGWQVVDAGVPGYNFDSEVQLFDWLADRYRPRVAVFTVQEFDDRRADFGDQLRAGRRRLAKSLDRFALYRFAATGTTIARYEFKNGAVDGPPDEARFARDFDQVRRTAARVGCRLVFHIVASPGQTGPRQEAEMIAHSDFRPFADVGATLFATEWQYRGPLTIPNDGHPTPAGAAFLADRIVPTLEQVLALPRLPPQR